MSDITGSVTKIQGKSISNVTPNDGEVLTWEDLTSEWKAKPIPSVPISGAAGGDLSGTYPNPTVAKVNGASVPAAGSLTTGNVLKVSGSSTLTYGGVDLAGGSGHVTGVLPTANQAAQSLGGHLSGTTAAAVVDKANGVDFSTWVGSVNTQRQVVKRIPFTCRLTDNNASSTSVSYTLPTDSTLSLHIRFVMRNVTNNANKNSAHVGSAVVVVSNNNGTMTTYGTQNDASALTGTFPANPNWTITTSGTTATLNCTFYSAATGTTVDVQGFVELMVV